MNTQVQLSSLLKPNPPSEWPAFLSLGFSDTRRGVMLQHYQHQGPLYVQKPFYPEGKQLAHCYLLHPPGGLVSGDHLQVEVAVDEQCRVLITTPGAGRVYRARTDQTLQRQNNHLKIANESSLEWLPLENIIFPGAFTQLNTTVDIEGSGKFIGWEITSFGLPAANAAFDQGEVDQTLQIHINERIVLRERLTLNDNSRELFTSQIGLANHPINGFMVAGPFEHPEALAPLLDRLRSLNTSDMMIGTSQVKDFLVVRALGNCSEQMRKHFSECWKLIRPELLQRVACYPRIWNT